MSLRDAAQALVYRWDTPLWNNVHATGEYINRLMEELAAAPNVEQESRGMFVARLENMVKHGDRWLTVESVLALLSDCDMLAQRSTPQIPQAWRDARKMAIEALELAHALTSVISEKREVYGDALDALRALENK